MEANVNIKYIPSELVDTLKEVVEERAGDEIDKIVSAKVKLFVDAEVQKKFSPIIDEYLKNIIVGREYPGYNSSDQSRKEVEKFVTIEIQKYLDEPVYLYSTSSTKISQRYAPSSSHNEKTRAERWISDMVEKCCEEKIYSMYQKVIENTTNKYIPKKEDIEKIVKDQISERLQQ